MRKHLIDWSGVRVCEFIRFPLPFVIGMGGAQCGPHLSAAVHCLRATKLPLTYSAGSRVKVSAQMQPGGDDGSGRIAGFTTPLLMIPGAPGGIVKTNHFQLIANVSTVKPSTVLPVDQICRATYRACR